jgi:tetratricopeptide (TPR) repeat protein
MLVMCLERRLEWNCEECRSRAHVQLAWAHYTAFGTPQNLERARLLVNKGGKSERHFRQLCGEANFWDYACQRSYGLSRKWEENKYDGQTDKGMASWFRAEGMEIAIDTLQAEFGGKKALNMALYSQINLAFTLASIHYAMADFENAELFHREVIVLHREMKNRETKLSPYRRLGFTPDLEDLVKVLGEQGKIHEGILELKNNTTAARNPNGKRKNFLIWLFQGQTGEDIPHRHALVKLYLQQEDTCALARIDLLGDLQDLQTKKEVQHRFKERSFYLVGQFARLMATQGHSDQASLILEERMKHMDDILGDDTNAETKARRQDALVFSQSMKHVKLAIDIQKQLLENDISQETAPEGSLALRMEYAFSLAQQGFIDEASKMCRYVLDVRATLEISESSYVVWECLEDFCGSIWYHNPGEWTRQSLMQKQLLEECEKSGDPVLKVKLLSILCLTTRRNGYEMIIERLRTLPSTLTSSLPDTLVVKLKIQCMLVFVLSSRGLAHESRKDLEEACTTAKDMLESLPSRSEMSKTGNLNTLAFVHRTATLAYLNKLVFLCHYEGFGKNCGKDDIGFMQEAISRHEDAVKEICSESHIHTLYARIQLATALYYVGHAMQNGTEFLRAKSLYEEVLLSKTREVGEPDEFPISEIPSVIISARLTRLEFEMGTTTIRKCNESNRAVRTLYNGWDSSHLARVAILIGYSEIDEDGVLEDSCLRDINMATRDFAKSRRRYHVNAEHHPDILKAWTMLSSLQSLSPGLSFLRAAANAAKLLHLKDEGLINPVTVKYRSILANGLFRHKATMAAGLQLYTEVLESEKTIFGELHTRTIASQRRLAMMHLKDDARDLARLLLHTALSNAVKLLGHGHTITLRVWECLLKVEGAEASDMEHKVERILHAIVGGRILKHRYQRLSAHLLLLVQAVQSGLRYHPFSVSIKEIMELIQHERYGINEEDASIIGRELEALLKTTLLA